jgi:hypothetical protein
VGSKGTTKGRLNESSVFENTASTSASGSTLGTLDFGKHEHFSQNEDKNSPQRTKMAINKTQAIRSPTKTQAKF